jgi:diaminopimelate decarboxylase/aspartate kinase
MFQNEKWVVLKFGGTSVSTRENWRTILQIIQNRQKQGYSVCLVHSALKGISNLLNQLLHGREAKEALALIEKIKKHHLSLADDLDLDGAALLNLYFEQLKKIVDEKGKSNRINPRKEAELMAAGELMATTLGSEYLKKNGLEICWKDARSCLKSVPQKNASQEQSILGAVCDDEQDERLQEGFTAANAVILTQGFIARDFEGETVLLGRGGSDVSAAYFAAKLNAKHLEIWTDVPGLFSTDPGQVSSARLLEKLSYEEAQEISANGAGVLHPGCINPARRHHIPIHVHCTQRPDLPGTVISDRISDEAAALKSVALRDYITLVSMESLGMWQHVGFLADAFSIFKQFGLSIDLISTSESNVTVSLDPSLNRHFRQIREEFAARLSKTCKVEVIESVSAISLLGQNVQSILHQIGDLFQIFLDYEIYMVSQASNNLNFTFVVDSSQAKQLVHQLHNQIITQSANQPFFGKTWPELMEPASKPVNTQFPWWETERKKLLKIAQKKGSVYVYSQKEIGRNIQKLRQLKTVDRYFYAMKANNNAKVLQQFYEAGLGFECVSIGEVQRILELFPKITPERILFTPNFAPRSEYECALEYGIHVTLDNIYPLQHWPEIFENRDLFLRIDTGHGYGHHKHVKTGGNASKFGIPRSELAETADLTEKIGARVIGLHAHVGSGIKNEQRWKETALILHNAAQYFGSINILDLGGGFGIAEHQTDSFLNMPGVNQFLQEFKTDHPEYELWVEPGRFLTASAGVLLTRVTQLKGKGKLGYVGTETGMNSFIRPALYGSNHTIVNLSELDKPPGRLVNIVGPICESADKLGVNRRFPKSEEGDVILIANTGAYGHVMSSNYNLRPPAEEVYLGDGEG